VTVHAAPEYLGSRLNRKTTLMAKQPRLTFDGRQYASGHGESTRIGSPEQHGAAKSRTFGAVFVGAADLFPGHKTRERSSGDRQPSADRNLTAHAGTRTFLTEAKNVVLLGPPAAGETARRRRDRHPVRQGGIPRVLRHPTGWVARLQHARP